MAQNRIVRDDSIAAKLAINPETAHALVLAAAHAYDEDQYGPAGWGPPPLPERASESN